MRHRLCFHNWSLWRCFGYKKAVGGKWESQEQGKPLDFRAQAANVGLEPPARAAWALSGALGCPQRCLRGWDVASSAASCLEMQPSWESPEAEVSWLAPAPFCPMTPEDAVRQGASGCPREGCQAPCAHFCWDQCYPTGKGSLYCSAGSSAPKAVEVTCHL